jgi:hypothetical protein
MFYHIALRIIYEQAGLLSLGLNMKDNFWRPLGQQLMGIIITHIRKQRITQDGAKVLLRDLDEFLNLTAAMGITEIVDMVVCLKEITKALLVPPEDVVKVSAVRKCNDIVAVVHTITRLILAFCSYYFLGCSIDSYLTDSCRWYLRISITST